MISPEDIREAREGLKDFLSRGNIFYCRDKNSNNILQTALEALDEVERLRAENTKLKNHLDIVYGEPGGGDGRG